MTALGEAFRLTEDFTLRNRLVATAHGRAAILAGLPTPADAEYWRRVSAGGVAMCISGGTVTAPESTGRGRIFGEAWREDGVEALALRAEAMHAGGAVAVLQLVHLGRETLGAETYYHPVAPSAVRSPREPTAPRALSDLELEAVLEGFRVSAANAYAAGFDGVELHAAHGYFLGQLLSPVVNRRSGAETLAGRTRPVMRLAREIRAAAPAGKLLGIRFSVGDEDDSGLDLEDTVELLGRLDPALDWVNLTVGMRSYYIRDMATTGPPLLDRVAALRAATELPLLISHGFREAAPMDEALAAGADLVGMARALVADPDLPRKVLAGEGATVRPCVACNEDCRSFDPALMCTVNPYLGAPGDAVRRAMPLLRGSLRPAPRRVAVVGAGPGGLEAALRLQEAEDVEVTVFEAAEEFGGTHALIGRAPSRSGWLRLVRFYRDNLDPGRVEVRLGAAAAPVDVADFDAVVVALGAPETLPDRAVGARTVGEAVAAGTEGLAGVGHLVVIDDGFAWWPHAMAIELGVAAGVEQITLVTPGVSFATGLPAEGRSQMLRRLRGRLPLAIRPLATATAIDAEGVELRDGGGAVERIAADAVVMVGERRPRDWSGFVDPEGPPVLVVGDAVNPRRTAHAVSEGRAAAEAILAGRLGDVERVAAGVLN
jgi:2,4-dienoyl-CoA reductase-like NADH-dependent reductase (Old Yellow Enzyme family)